MKFWVICKDLRFQARRFDVRQCPNNNNELKNKLIENPPLDVNKAKQIFKYLASQKGFINWKPLFDIDFIPIRDKIWPNVRLTFQMVNRWYTIINRDIATSAGESAIINTR